MISKRVEKLKEKYQEQSTKIVEGLERNQWDIIKRVYFYKNDRFVENSDPSSIFWQVVTPFLPHFTKLLDIDLKDINPKGQGDTNFYQAWILRRKLHSWFNQGAKLSGDDFGVFIDDLTKDVASFGSYIVKINRKTNEPEFVDLRHIAFDPSLKTIRGEDKVEFHQMTEGEIKKKSNVWDKTDEIINKAEEVDDKKEVWEFWGEIEKDGEFKFKHIIGAGYGKDEVIAVDEELNPKVDPYYDIHLGPYEGMWLRRGIYEICFDEQWRALEVVNQNREATQIASLLLLRSSDPNTTGNVLHQAVSGQIIESEDLQQIGIDNRAFTALLNELQTIESQVRKKLQLPDVATGETLPSGIPFRGMALLSSAQKDSFKQTRLRVANGIVNIIERIIPELVKDWNRGDVIEIAEDKVDIERYDEAVRRVALKQVYQKANSMGIVVTDEIEERIDRMIDEKIKKNGRKIKTPKGFFNFEFGFKIDPVGEMVDRAQKNDAIINALTLVLQNPVVNDIPLFNQLLEENNISPFKLKPETVKAIMENPDSVPQEEALRALSQNGQERSN